MSRKICNQCLRPEVACICAFISPVNNTIDVVVLQHPGEVSQAKGTVALLSRSLRSCQVIVGEDFSRNIALNDVLKQYQGLLLYPSEKSIVLTEHYLSMRNEEALKGKGFINTDVKPYCLIILDGTWKKAYRMLMLCQQLQQLPQICLPDSLAQAGQYKIRKVAKRNALSSLEACCYALSLLESHSDDICKSEVLDKNENENEITSLTKYHELMKGFLAFNEFQLSFRPAAK